LNARDSEEEPSSRSTAKRNKICPFGRRADDIDDDHDDDDDDGDGDGGGDVGDRGRPRDEMENALGTGHGGCDEECQEIISEDSVGESYGAMMNEKDKNDECSSDAAVRRRDAATEQVDAGRHVSEVVGVQGLRRSERQRQRRNIERTEQINDVVRPEAVRPKAVRPEKMESKAERNKRNKREWATKGDASPSSMAPDVVVVKLGGAILTKKHQRGVLDRRGLRDCVDAVVAASRAGCSLVVVHGAGGFGHGMFGVCARRCRRPGR
jgi:hypothetical protein